MTSDDLAVLFEQHRTHLRAVAYRMLGSVHEADDAVQETWLRLSRTDVDEIDNLGGWLTTVVSRICLDLLRRRTSRREDPLPEHDGDDVAVDPGASRHPEHEALLADQVGTALLLVLDALSPAERLAFVLHDLFALPFEEVASVMGRSTAAVRQLASRGRRRVQSPAATPEPDRRTQHRVVDAFLAASRGGDFQALVEMLDPDAVVLADGAAVRMGSAAEVRGATAVAETFSGRALGASLVLLDGYAGALWMMGDAPRVAFAFTLDGERIVEIELLADPEVLSTLDVSPVSRQS
jgi:RNA polymerase sigma-70 factor (ECF subfamily)